MSGSVPVGVKVISILYIIGAVISVIAGVSLFFGSSALAGLLGTFGSVLGGALFVVGIILVGVGVLGFFIGRGLWKGKNWARITAIVLALIGFVLTLIAVIGGSLVVGNVISLVVDGVIAGYLLFSKSVKQAFA